MLLVVRGYTYSVTLLINKGFICIHLHLIVNPPGGIFNKEIKGNFVLPYCIVYTCRFRCAGCSACYVGETSRHICTRINKHLNMDKASHIFKHLQDSPRCQTLCSSECFVVIDQARTRTQLKIKEAVHIHWEKPSLNQQLFHVNLNLSLYHTIVILIFCYVILIFRVMFLKDLLNRSLYGAQY